MARKDNEHGCNQEATITELKTNGSWMMQKIEKIDAKVDKVQDDVSDIKNILTSGDGKIKVLNKAVFGSESQPGFNKRLSDIEAIINEMRGVIKFVKFIAIVGGINLVTLLVLIIRAVMRGDFK